MGPSRQPERFSASGTRDRPLGKIRVVRPTIPPTRAKPLKYIGKDRLGSDPLIDFAWSPESISGVSVRVPQL